MRITIEFPDQPSSAAIPDSPHPVELASVTPISVSGTDSSGGPAPENVRVVAQSNAAVGMDAFAAGAAEENPPPAPNGAAEHGAHNGGPAPN